MPVAQTQPVRFATTARPPRWRWPALVLLALLYTLLFGEFFLRLLAPQALVPRYVTAGADGVRANIPNARFRQWTPEVDVTIRYNSAGQRDDRPPPGPRVPGDCRIALLGDSYFIGFESSFANSFAARLEHALDRRGHPCRVVNFAVSGFGHAENLAILESRVRLYRPDLLLMSVHQTDGYDNIRSNLFKVSANHLVRASSTFLPGIAISDRLNRYAAYRWAQENSHLYSALREWAGAMGKKLLATLRVRTAADESETDKAADIRPDGAIGGTLPAWAGNTTLNGKLIEAVDREGKEMGARLMLFEIPSSSSRSRYISVINKLVPANILSGTPHASPLERFERMAAPETQFYLERGHKHWTTLGNEVAAQAAADAIVSQHLLPGLPGDRMSDDDHDKAD